MSGVRFLEQESVNGIDSSVAQPRAVYSYYCMYLKTF